jgi:hypothetical protein
MNFQNDWSNAFGELSQHRNGQLGELILHRFRGDPFGDRSLHCMVYLFGQLGELTLHRFRGDWSYIF